jgi:hypothetical protein
MFRRWHRKLAGHPSRFPQIFDFVVGRPSAKSVVPGSKVKQLRRRTRRVATIEESLLTKNKCPREVESHAGNRSDETRTDALVPQPETGKIAASIIPVMAGCHPARSITYAAQ